MGSIRHAILHFGEKDVIVSVEFLRKRINVGKDYSKTAEVVDSNTIISVRSDSASLDRITYKSKKGLKKSFTLIGVNLF